MNVKGLGDWPFFMGLFLQDFFTRLFYTGTKSPERTLIDF
jgi:hypothetical protein